MTKPFDVGPSPSERIAALSPEERAARYLQVIHEQGLSMAAMRREADKTAAELTKLRGHVTDVTALAKILWRLDCKRADDDARLESREPPEQWADPWDASGCGVHQQRRYLDDAKFIIDQWGTAADRYVIMIQFLTQDEGRRAYEAIEKLLDDMGQIGLLTAVTLEG